MTCSNEGFFAVSEPNWEPLEQALSPEECMDFMYMGRVGKIELYKHRWTRRYLNISSDCDRFYLYTNGNYVEVERSMTLDHVRS